MDPAIRDRELRLWQTLGPTAYRLRSVGVAVLLALGGAVVFLGFMTAINHFPGTGAVYEGQESARCAWSSAPASSFGPISKQGFGYWWECDAAVTGSGTVEDPD